LDEQGIYYDPTRPSALEGLLRNHPFSEEERALGRELIEIITSQRLSKYNVQEDAPLSLPPMEGKSVHLIIGQVDDDASVLLGSHDVKSSAELLRVVRNQHPDGYLVYKPHPDVVAENRRAPLPADAQHLADWIETSHSISSCLDVASRVHTMTSFAGFEALLRGIPVSTYGLPFYAGWGLTHDTQSCERRTRKLKLEELVCASL